MAFTMSKAMFQFSALLQPLLDYLKALLLFHGVFQKENPISKSKCKLCEG